MKTSRSRLVLGCLFTPPLLICTLLYLLYVGIYSLGGYSHSIVVGPNGQAYIADPGSGGFFLLPFPNSGGCVWVVDTQSDRLSGLVTTSIRASEVGVATNGRVYARYHGSYEGTTGYYSLTPQPSMLSRNAASMLALSTGHILVPDEESILVIDCSTDQIIKRIIMPDDDCRGLVAISAREAYALFRGQVIRLNLENYAILSSIELPSSDTVAVVASRKEGMAYVATSSKVFVIDTQAHRVVGVITIFRNQDSVIGLCLTSEEKLYVLKSAPLDSSPYLIPSYYHITVVSPQSRQVLGEIKLPEERESLDNEFYRYRIAAVSTGKVYVVHGTGTYNSSFQDSPETYVIVIDPQRDEIVGTILLQRPMWAKLWPFEGVWAFIVLACLSPGVIAALVLVVSLRSLSHASVRGSAPTA